MIATDTSEKEAIKKLKQNKNKGKQKCVKRNIFDAKPKRVQRKSSESETEAANPVSKEKKRTKKTKTLSTPLSSDSENGVEKFVYGR